MPIIQVTLIYGTNDEYLDENRIKDERQRAKTLFGERLEIIPFEGKHVVNVELIHRMAESIN